MLGLIFAQPGLIIGQGLTQRPHLRIQEMRGGFRLLLAGAHVLVNEERGQGRVHLLSNGGVGSLISQPEGD